MSAARFRRRRLVGVAVAVVAVAVVAVACGDSTVPTAEIPEPTAPTVAEGTVTSTSSTTTTVPAAVDLDVGLVLTPIATLEAPTSFAAWPGTDVALIGERAGRIMAVDLRDTPATVEGVVLDVTDRVGGIEGEGGLLGLAIDAEATVLVVSYTDGNDDGASVIETYALGSGTVDAASRREVLRLAQPFANHNGGHVAFGPEGSLYVGFGDGGSQGDPGNNAQNTFTLLGSMIRIDLNPADAPLPYSVRSDNPFPDGVGGRQELFLYGVRNPWRFSFDAVTGDLWIGDVGASAWEEIDVLWASDGGGAGANLGWPFREGRHDTGRDGTPPTTVVEPIAEYDHDQGSSVTGGYVYRGDAIEELRGAYLYADYTRPVLRALAAAQGATEPTDRADLRIEGDTPNRIVSFGEDRNRELYVLSLEGGVYRLDPA